MCLGGNLKRKNFSIDTREKNSSSSSNSNFNIDLDMPRNNKFNKCSLAICEVPKSWYLIDSTNNTFTLKEGAGADATATIVSGKNYTTTQLAAAVVVALDAAGAAPTYTCTFDSQTGKFTITASAGDFLLKMANSPDLAKYLGLEADDTSNQSTSSVLVSSNVIDLQRYDVIRLRSNMAINNNDDVLSPIYVGDTTNFDYVHYVTPDLEGTSVTLHDSNRNNYSFSLVDRNNTVIDLNGGHCRFSISVWDCGCN